MKKRINRVDIRRKNLASTILIILILILIILSAIFIIFNLINQNSLTGKVILNNEIETTYDVGDKLNGAIVLAIEQGDLIINSTLINFQLKKGEEVVQSRDITFNDFLIGQIEALEIINETDNSTNYYFNQAGSYSRQIGELIDYTFADAGEYKLVISSSVFGASSEKEIVVEGEGLGINNIGAMQSGTATNASGSVYQCGTITSAGTYTLNASITSEYDCITISADNVVLDGNGKTITFATQGSAGNFNGILVSGSRNNITIKNFAGITGELSGDSCGISTGYNYFLTNSTIYNNTIYVSDPYSTSFGSVGIWIDGDSTNNNITKNNIYGEARAISLGFGDSLDGTASGNFITNNNLSSDGEGLFFGTSSSNIIYNNTIISGGYGVYSVSYSNSDIINRNIISSVTSDFFLETITTADNYATNLSLIDQKIAGYTITNPSTIIFQNTTSGKIDFYQGGAGTGISGSGTNLFAGDVDIKNNFAYVNEEQVSFNVNAKVSLYNVGISNGAVLKGGVACSEDTCSELTSANNSDGTYNYSFSVSSWSNYSIGETPDTTAPVVNLTFPISGTTYSGSTYNINFTFNVTDDSAIANCTAYVSGTAYSNISSITKSVLNGINATLAAASYSAYVNCTDLLGNTGNSSNIIFTITIPPATTPAVSGGGGSARFWKSTSDVTGSNIVNMDLGYFKELGVQERVKISFGIDAGGNEETHYIGAVSIASDSQSAVIQIMSDPMNVTFKIGEEKKFDLNNDMFYDLYVKLNSIINKKANVTIKKINEPITGSAVDETKKDENGIPLVEVNYNQSQTEKPSVSIVDNWRMYLMILIFALSIFSIIFHLIKVRKREKDIVKLKKRR